MRRPSDELLDATGAPYADFEGGESVGRSAVPVQQATHIGNTEVLPPGFEKFHVPEPPTFEAFDSWMSIASLLGLFLAALLTLLATPDAELWVRLPFLTLAVGAGIGFLYELTLVLVGRGYQLLTPPFGPFVQLVRGVLFAIVVAASIHLLASLIFRDENAREVAAVLSGFGGGFLFVAFTLQARPLRVLVALLATLLILLAAMLWVRPFGFGTTTLLAVAAALLLLSPVAGAETPRNSLVFHVMGTGSTLLLYWALVRLGLAGAEAVADPAPLDAEWSLLGLLIGAIVAFLALPETWARLRSMIVNIVWPLFYLVIAGGPRIPRPERLGDVYHGVDHLLKPLPVWPYYVAHPRQLTHAVAVPCLDEALTVKVHRLGGGFVGLVKLVFGIASFIDQLIPHANVNVPIARKPRLRPWSDGSDYWPGILGKRIYIPWLGWFDIASGVRGPGRQPAPDTAIEAYKRGQLLAYLVEHSVANPFLTSEVVDGRTVFTLDLTFLEEYETKPDYEPYGGLAKFVVDDEAKSLRLESVQAPRSQVAHEPDPLDASFRRAEAMVVASVYFYVVSGKHLVEIRTAAAPSERSH